MIGRDAEGNPGFANLPLRSHQPLGKRRLVDEERARDLVRLQTRDLAERQGDLRLGCEGRVAAGEDEAKAFVGDRAHAVFFLGAQALESCEQLGLACERALAADPVDRAVAGRRDDPCTGIARRALSRPALDGRREGVLHRVLGALEVTEDADENGNRTSPLLAKDGVDVYCVTSGRISTEPLPASGTRSAISIAWSRSLHSTRK